VHPISLPLLEEITLASAVTDYFEQLTMVLEKLKLAQQPVNMDKTRNLTNPEK
jgi:hypothetical protein